MALEPVVIPEKIYFKIGEVCELVGVQAHVLRYWETEFSTLSPQKNKSGQRSYRRRDVEIALRIKQLLYNEMFTIAGARKKLQSEAREGSKPKVEAARQPDTTASRRIDAPTLFDTGFDDQDPVASPPPNVGGVEGFTYTGDQRDALKTLAGHLLELREMLKSSQVS
jgi:DNA-binding transcriptional MerR regulator